MFTIALDATVFAFSAMLVWINFVDSQPESDHQELGGMKSSKT
jgi:hypothetical protein